MTGDSLTASEPLPRTGPFRESTDAWSLLALVFIAVVSSVPFFYAAGGAMPEAHDLRMHWIRMIAFDEGLRSGDLFPRWLASLNHGYGAATTLFYAPGVYYALSMAHALTGEWRTAIEALVVSAAAASAGGCYWYLRCFIAPRPAAVASALYVLLPYRLIDLYHRAAFAELLAFVWMPLLMLSLTMALRKRTLGPVIAGAVVFALMVLSHPPTAYLFALAFGLFAIILAVAGSRWRAPILASVMLGLGGGLSAFYSIPAISELQYVRQTITSSFLDRPGYLPNLISGEPFDRLVGAVGIATFLLTVLFSLSLIKRGGGLLNSEAGAHSIGWYAVSLLSFLMMLPIAGPVIRILPGLSGTGFLWRWLAIQLLATAAAGGFAFAAEARAYPDGAVRPGILVVGLVTATALVLGFGLYASFTASNLKVRFDAALPALEEAFTPKTAADVRTLPANAPLASTSTPGCDLSILEWRPSRRHLLVRSPEKCDVEVRTFAFPGWEASVDSVAAVVEMNEASGAIVVRVPSGQHEMSLVFSDTPIRKQARAVSVITLTIILMLIAALLFRSRLARLGTFVRRRER